MFLLEAWGGDGQRGSAVEGLDEDEELAEEAKRLVLSPAEPFLSATEPLLLEHFHCRSPVMSVFWHPILGIFSVGADGTVLLSDTCGAATYSIQAAAGRNSVVTAADLSLELEQVALGSNRGIHLWQCVSQTKAGFLDTAASGLSRSQTRVSVLLLRYLPSNKFLFSLHETDGAILIWDIATMELHRAMRATGCPRATCATWDVRRMTLLIFSTERVVEGRIEETELELTHVRKQHKIEKLSGGRSTSVAWAWWARAVKTPQQAQRISGTVALLQPPQGVVQDSPLT